MEEIKNVVEEVVEEVKAPKKRTTKKRTVKKEEPKKLRGFEEVDKKFKKHEDETQKPVRADKGSAGYDFYSKEEYVIGQGKTHVFWTDVKAYMQEGEVLMLYVRSSMGIKKGGRLANGTGIIDASYYSNPDNDGNIGICIQNIGKRPLVIKEGERIAQGVFLPFLVADEDEVLKETRDGGIGSSN